MGMQANSIVNHSLRVNQEGFEIQVCLDGNSSIPFSGIKSVNLSVDEKKVSPSLISCNINGHECLQAEKSGIDEVTWYGPVIAKLKVAQSNLVRFGYHHTIEVGLTFHQNDVIMGSSHILRDKTIQVAI